ncbi:ring-like domain-containing protein [Ophiostoma piceae UAMH 11346]|uniref:Ring-like domain-containing protein n=1 Tax=Ophiostoma piceae (strain UAMH 11346) TaxID=1262450 RepID=S3C7S7_OPHP1|nr:ring-like domain-containing protein [Ophiostoma piceae UAMH 11346]
MLEYLSYKKYRKHKEEKDKEEADAKGKGKAVEEKPVAGESAAPNETDAKTEPKGTDGVPVLDRDEQSFLENLTRHWGHEDDDDDIYGADDDANGEKPPLPPRMKTPDLTWDSDSESFVREDRFVAVDEEIVGDKKAEKQNDKDKDKETGGGVGRRLSTLFRKKDKAAPSKTPGHLAVPGTVDVDAALAAGDTQLVVSTSEEERERADIARVLENLDLGRKDDKDDKDDKEGGKDGKEQSKGKMFAMTLSAESTELVRRFVLVLKDLVNGVPTAADDLKHLLDDRDGTLARGFEKLPSSMRKLVSQLPSKLTSTLAPELLAAAAESQGVKFAVKDEGMDAKSAAKAMFLPLVTKPTAIVKMLKAIMNALKLRWPAFIGTSAIWSVALFLLMFVLWYCHKRGREVRLGKEADDADAATETSAEAGPALTDGEPAIVVSSDAETTTLPRPPIGLDAPK